ncbi:MAG: RNA 3'-terminal phosphate cyclase [Candidatus Promineifilaceae bacterium]
MITIDGSQGEGGGQVLRTSLSLSAVTGHPFRIIRIRAKRNKPGLRPQHLTAVRAVAEVCNASLEGDELNSTTLVFQPGSPPVGGSYRFDVNEVTSSGRSAGAVTLIFQALLWPLLFADQPSEVILRGGTFVPFSPPYHYLSDVALPAYARFGASFDTSLSAWGWMNDGGGEMVASIQPGARLEGVDFETVTGSKVEGIAAVTNLPSHIPHRMARRAYNLLTGSGFEVNVQPVRERGAGPGAGIVLWMPQGGFSSLGRKGLPADKVAEAAVAELTSFVDNGAAVDHHLADQLLVPMALAHGRSTLTTHRLTSHALTNIALLRQWLNSQIDVRGALDRAGKVSVNGIGWSRD